MPGATGYGPERFPHLPAWKQREQARRVLAELRRQGYPVNPVVIEGALIARTFWGIAWCRNLESYSDFANRLPRGRTYARNGSVIDLQVEPGVIRALVSGSALYGARVEIQPIARRRWRQLVKECAGRIDSVVELLSGRISVGVMEILCRRDHELFPSNQEIAFSCSCPDGARLCKHLAAALYGVGARLDHQPELLFLLRGVDQADLVSGAREGTVLGRPAPPPEEGALERELLSEIFGIEIAPAPASASEALDAEGPERPGRKRKARRR